MVTLDYVGHTGVKIIFWLKDLYILVVCFMLKYDLFMQKHL